MHYGIDYPDVKHRHHTKYVVIHEYDDKDDGDKGFYSGPSHYTHSSEYDSDNDKDKFDFDSDHYAFVHGFGDSPDGHSPSFAYNSEYGHGDKKSAISKKPSKLPKKYSGKDNGKKFQYAYYDNFAYPAVGLKEAFSKPKFTHKSLDSGYEVKPAPLKIISPTRVTFTHGPTTTSYKTNYVGPTTKSFISTSGYYVSPKVPQPTLVPFQKSHSSTPLNAEFEEYNDRREHAADYIHSNEKAPFVYSATLGNPQYELVRDGVVTFVSGIGDKYGGADSKEDKNTLENLRKEDEEDAKAHAEFVTSIEEDHKVF